MRSKDNARYSPLTVRGPRRGFSLLAPWTASQWGWRCAVPPSHPRSRSRPSYARRMNSVSRLSCHSSSNTPCARFLCISRPSVSMHSKHLQPQQLCLNLLPIVNFVAYCPCLLICFPDLELGEYVFVE